MTRAVPRWTHWQCSCGAKGSFRWADIKTKTDVTPDAKHVSPKAGKCRGVVTTSTRADLVASIATQIGRLA